ncbi:hypothetical protein ILUMI_01643, partial [Ignelater luminosus]
MVFSSSAYHYAPKARTTQCRDDDTAFGQSLSYILDDAPRVYSGDKTNFQLCPNQKTALAPKSCKKVYEIDLNQAQLTPADVAAPKPSNPVGERQYANGVTPIPLSKSQKRTNVETNFDELEEYDSTSIIYPTKTFDVTNMPVVLMNETENSGNLNNSHVNLNDVLLWLVTPEEKVKKTTENFRGTQSDSEEDVSGVLSVSGFTKRQQTEPHQPTTTKARKTRQRIVWNNEMNLHVMRCYYTITNLETKPNLTEIITTVVLVTTNDPDSQLSAFKRAMLEFSDMNPTKRPRIFNQNNSKKLAVVLKLLETRILPYYLSTDDTFEQVHSVIYAPAVIAVRLNGADVGQESCTTKGRDKMMP